MKAKLILVVLIGLNLMTGCATVQTGLGFDEVKQTVSTRIDKQVHWNQGTELDEAVEKEVKSLLQAELTADTAVQIGLLNNRDLQADFEELNIAQADLVEAGLLRNPVFDTEIRFAGGGGTSLELAVVQNFIDVLFIPLRKRFAQIGFEAAKLRASSAVLILAGEIRTAFFTLQGALQELEMRRQILTALEASYLFAKRLKEAGNVTDLVLSNEQALYEQSRLDTLSAEVQVLRNREELNSSMGLWGEDTNWTIASKLPDILPETVPADGLEATALQHSLELAVAKRELEQAAAALGIARPFDIYSEGAVGVSAEREFEGMWGVGPALSLPLPIFNQGQPAVASAQAFLRSAEQRYFAKAVSLRSAVRNLYAQLLALRSRITHYETVMLPLRTHIVAQTQLQFNAMQIGPFQLLQAKKDQIEVGSAYIETLRDYWLTHTELEQLLAGGKSSQKKRTGDEMPSPDTSSSRGH